MGHTLLSFSATVCSSLAGDYLERGAVAVSLQITVVVAFYSHIINFFEQET